MSIVHDIATVDKDDDRFEFEYAQKWKKEIINKIMWWRC